jgi:hypothetical protein
MAPRPGEQPSEEPGYVPPLVKPGPLTLDGALLVVEAIYRALGDREFTFRLPAIDDDRVYHHGPTFSYPFTASGRRQMLAWLRKHGDHDAYFTAALDPIAYLFADLDRANPRKIKFRPTIAWETSPGRWQAVWVIIGRPRKSVTRKGGRNHRLTHSMKADGADPSGFDKAQILRLPGRLNHKPDYLEDHPDGAPGRLLWADGPTYEWSDFDGLPEVDDVAADGPEVEIDDEDIKRLKPQRQKIWNRIKEDVPRDVKQLMANRGEVVKGEHSGNLFRMECTFLELGCTPAEVYVLVSPTPWNKWRSEPWLLKEDIGRAVAKVGQLAADREEDEEKPAADHRSLMFPEKVWQHSKRKALRRHAHARLASGDAVLLAVLARISSRVSPECRVETGMGGSLGLSLNFNVALVGETSGGKSMGAGTAKHAMAPSLDCDIADNLTLSTGQGIAEAFMGEELQDTGEVYKTGDRKGQPKTEKVRKQVRGNAFFVLDEGQAFVKQLKDPDSITGEVIRTTWFGDDIGSANATAERKREVIEGKYSMGMVIGFQPDTIQPLLHPDEQAAGTTARFDYGWADGPIPRDVVESSFAKVEPPRTRQKMTLPPRVVKEVRDHHYDRRDGKIKVKRLDGHGYAHRIKVAGLLALHRDPAATKITEDDWEIAGLMWETSRRVRDYLIRYGQRRATKQRDEKDDHTIALAARTQRAVSQVDQTIERCARLIPDHVRDEKKITRTKGLLKHRQARRDAPYFEEALAYALEHRWVIETSPGRYEAGPPEPP